MLGAYGHAAQACHRAPTDCPRPTRGRRRLSHPRPGRAVVPSAADAWLTAMARYGRLTLAEVAAPAIELAERGFPVDIFLHHKIRQSLEMLETLPTLARSICQTAAYRIRVTCSSSPSSSRAAAPRAGSILTTRRRSPQGSA